MSHSAIWLVILALTASQTLARTLEEPPIEGLYDSKDDVHILANDTFTDSVFNQDHATLVEFYNSFCGFCRKYAPTWKEFATDVIAWQRVVHVAAVNCAADENSNLCRKYEVMAYPSLRYFPPGFNDPNTYGIPMTSSHSSAELRSSLIDLLRNDTAAPAHWPNLAPVADTHKSNLFDSRPEQVQYVLLMYVRSNGSLANQLALDFSGNPNIAVEWINSSEVARSFGLTLRNSVAVVNRNLDLFTLAEGLPDRSDALQTIRKFLDERNLTATSTTESNQQKGQASKNQSSEFQMEPSRTDLVFLADLQHAAWYSLFHEVSQFIVINGERLEALKRYINILKRYLPFGENGHEFLEELNAFTVDTTEISGDLFAEKLKQLKSRWHPINVTNRWMGCQGSLPNLRGYSCGLWELFHFLTVQSALDTNSSDPLDALKAIHGYVKNFFGCTDCSQHFQAMADELQIWQVTSKDEAVLWLWRAHNQVNKRLAGDATEDAAYPKIQFPSPATCASCRDRAENWELPEVLRFLKELYSAQNVTRSVDFNTPQAERRILDNVFSDLDMRMGILLYVSCIAMLAVAVKLLVRRGYRRKLYSYDFKV